MQGHHVEDCFAQRSQVPVPPYFGQAQLDTGAAVADTVQREPQLEPVAVCQPVGGPVRVAVGGAILTDASRRAGLRSGRTPVLADTGSRVPARCPAEHDARRDHARRRGA